MARLPHDEFDDVPASVHRVGAHRAPKPRGRGWFAFLWGLLAVVVLTLGGLYALSRLNPDLDLALPSFGGGGEETPVATPTTAPTAEPVTDPGTVDPALGLAISVLNANGTPELQNQVGDLVAGAGWPDPARNRAASEAETTTIYYWSSDFEGIARGLAQLIGGAEVELSDAYLGAPVTIVLGADYVPPAG